MIPKNNSRDILKQAFFKIGISGNLFLPLIDNDMCT